jgi:hypothetical protein
MGWRCRLRGFFGPTKVRKSECMWMKRTIVDGNLLTETTQQNNE